MAGPGQPGFEPRTRDAERRDFYDLRRRVVAADEIWVGPDPPPADHYELWIDTDAVPGVIELEGQSQIIDISKASGTVGTTPVVMGTIDFGIKTYNRMIVGAANALFNVDAAASYFNFSMIVAGAGARFVRIRQISQPCSAALTVMRYCPAGTVGTVEVRVTCNTNATVSTAGSSDYNALHAFAIPMVST